MDPMFVKVVILVGLAILCWRLGVAARTSTPAANVFGGFYTAFVIVLIFLVLVLSKMKYVSALTDTCVEGVDFVSTSIASKFNKHATTSATGTTGGATSAATPVPTGNPNDYIEWVDHTHVQPKPGATLPADWSVTILPADANKRQRVMAPIEVPDEPLTVYFDPDPAKLPAAKSFGQVAVTGRP